jgi:hypothetical protein
MSDATRPARRPPVRLTAFARSSHNEVIPAARDAIAAAGGSILDFHLFSNAVLCLTIEIRASRLAQLADELAAAGIRLDEGSLALMREVAADGTAAADAAALDGTLSITLIHDEPPLIIEVPAVPG